MTEQDRQFWEQAAQVLRQHRPFRNTGTDENGRAIRCLCGQQFRASNDYDQAVADHQAAEIAQAMGHDVPVGSLW